MKSLVRVPVTLISAVASLYFVFWVGSAVLLPLHLPPWIPFLGSSLIALSVAWYVWRHTAFHQASLVSSIVVGALTAGGIGFSAGFFGPILFTPESNQGPLLGIFLTGPLGFLLGAVGGGIYWFARGRPAARKTNPGAV
jgi:hypothetical protein